MFSDAHITKEDFSNLHNGLCELRSAIERLEGVITPSILDRLCKAQDLLIKGLNNAYAQEDNAYKHKSSHYDKVKEEISATSEWSLYEVNDLTLPHPFKDAKSVLYDCSWGEVTETSIEGPTWRDLYKAADICIKESGDQHHIFIESFKVKDDKLVLYTGS